MRSTFLCTAAVMLAAAGCTTKTDQATKTTTSQGGSSTAPAGSSAARQDKALVRFVNADPRVNSADLWFGEQRPFSNVNYKSVTPYSALPDDRGTFKLRMSGAATDLATNSEGLDEGRRYTIVAMRNSDGTARLTAISDDLEAPAEGKAKVRVINGAARAGELSLAATGRDSKIVDDLNFGNSSGFKDIEASTGNLEILREDSSTPAIRLSGMNVQPGHLYTIIVTGEQALEAIRIEDQLMQQQAAGIQ